MRASSSIEGHSKARNIVENAGVVLLSKAVPSPLGRGASTVAKPRSTTARSSARVFGSRRTSVRIFSRSRGRPYLRPPALGRRDRVCGVVFSREDVAKRRDGTSRRGATGRREDAMRRSAAAPRDAERDRGPERRAARGRERALNDAAEEHAARDGEEERERVEARDLGDGERAAVEHQERRGLEARRPAEARRPRDEAVDLIGELAVRARVEAQDLEQRRAAAEAPARRRPSEVLPRNAGPTRSPRVSPSRKGSSGRRRGGRAGGRRSRRVTAIRLLLIDPRRGRGRVATRLL